MLDYKNDLYVIDLGFLTEFNETIYGSTEIMESPEYKIYENNIYGSRIKAFPFLDIWALGLSFCELHFKNYEKF